jgi:hypothetical protein
VVAGTTTRFQGTGTVAGLGQVDVTGSLVTQVNPSGQLSTTATFTLTTAKGSVTIQFATSGRIASPSATIQSSFSIIKATGAFQGDVGHGTATLRTLGELVPVVPPTVARGVFTLALNSSQTIL